MRKFFRFKKKYHDIDPDEIFLDSENLPGFDNDLFEGRIEKPISKRSVTIIGTAFAVVFIIFLARAYSLQIVQGEELFNRSEKNLLRHTIIFADRGLISDRNNVPLAWNEQNASSTEFNLRKYIEKPGFSHLLGYVKYPQKDKNGFYFNEKISGTAGIEKFYDEMISGENGTAIVETDAINTVVSGNTIFEPKNGDNIVLTIDSRLQEALYNSIKEISDQVGFHGGGGVIMDIHTGDILAMASYPEFDSQIMTDGDKDKIKNYNDDGRNPFLNRVTQGLYTPGSIIKPFIAMAALNENIISPNKTIFSAGEMIVPNPYDPKNPSYFSDWKAHGAVDIRKALAVSSNIYFYEIGGGYGDQKGLGITLINKYLREFGFGEKMTDKFFDYEQGAIPNPEWKKKIFDDDWRIGDTYFTAIGQYGFQATPIQFVRAISAMANGGMLVEPRIIANYENETSVKKIDISSDKFQIVREGMREAVLTGTAKGLNVDYVKIGGKTGTAELGVSKERVNSWTEGFFPYNDPKYAFVVVMEKGGRHNLIGAVAVSRKLFDWMNIYTPEYFE